MCVCVCVCVCFSVCGVRNLNFHSWCVVWQSLRGQNPGPHNFKLNFRVKDLSLGVRYKLRLGLGKEFGLGSTNKWKSK